MISSRSRTTLLWTLLAISLVGVCLPRFNRNDRFVPSTPADDVQYQLYVRYFRGEEVADALRAASTWRPLTPLLAAGLPLEPMTALNVVNVLALLAALFFMLATLRHLGLHEPLVWTGAFLFVFSFPTFYYATIGYVDPLLIFFLQVGVFLILTGRWGLLAGLMLVGTLAKEGIVILIPSACAALWMRGQLKEKFYWPLLYGAAYALVSVLVRKLAPGQTPVSFWQPSIDIFMFNASRPRAWLSAVLTFGVPGLLSLPLLRHLGSMPRSSLAVVVPLFAGFTAGLATWGAAFVSAFADGRTLWTMYPFAIPMAMLWLATRRRSRQMVRGDVA